MFDRSETEYCRLLRKLLLDIAELHECRPEWSEGFRQAERLAMDQLGDDVEPSRPGRIKRMFSGSHG